MDFISRFGARTGMKAGFCVEKPRLISDGVFVMTPGNVRCILPRSEESLYLPMPRTTAMNPSSPPPACRGHAEHGGRGEKSGCWMKKLFVQQPLLLFLNAEKGALYAISARARSAHIFACACGLRAEH